MYLEIFKEKRLIKGGGYHNTPLKALSIKTPQRSIFKPIVASSLALFLGANFAYANCNDSKPSDKPTFCAGNQGSELLVPGKLDWWWWNKTDIFTPELPNGGKYIAIQFDDRKYDLISDPVTNGSSGETFFYTNANSFVFRGNGGGVKVNSLRVYFDGANNKNFTLDLSRSKLFEGGIEVKGDGTNNTFNADLPYGMSGYIYLDSNAKANIVLGKNTKITGNITSTNRGGNLIIKNGTLAGQIGAQSLVEPNTKDLVIVFDGAKMEGNIQTGSNISYGNDFQRKEITFKNAADNNLNVVLTGNIIAYGSGYGFSLDRSKGNHVTFESGSMKGNVWAYTDRHERAAYNEIVFKGENARLGGNIEASGGSYYGGSRATNRVIFEQSGVISGYVLATSNTNDSTNKVVTPYQGKNEIIFNGESGNAIEGGVIAKSGINEIVFNNKSAANTIAGGITAGDAAVASDSIKATNTITFNGSSNTINGDVSAKKSDGSAGSFLHENIITFNGGNNTINGQVTTDTSLREYQYDQVRYGGQNIITIRDAVLTIKSLQEGRDKDPIITLNRGINIINLEGNRAELKLQRTYSAHDGNIYNRDPSSTATVNFNAKESLLFGNIVNNGGIININLNEGVDTTIKGHIRLSRGNINISLDNNARLSTKQIISEESREIRIDVGDNATIEGNLSLAGHTYLDFRGNSVLNLTGGDTTKKINELSTAESGIINLSGQMRYQDTLVSKQDFQTLEINKLNARNPLSFIVYVDPNTKRSDRVVIESNIGNSSNTKVHHLGVIGNPDELIGKDLYTQGSRDNIVLATVADSSGITLEATDSINGFSLVTYDFTKESGSNYTTYFLGSVRSKGASVADQLTSTSALSANYDLYLANLNSLNKRMGELRNNANSQGVWIRVFNGMQTSKFALETKSNST
ncbi:hypothetical protein, partial [Helicobacter sp. 'CLO3_human']|uniref:hypothetical protein n=1 Tax=Helicobacter sp. 'CLO3_human' TaxID=2020249 RepID=UPI0013157E8A